MKRFLNHLRVSWFKYKGAPACTACRFIGYDSNGSRTLCRRFPPQHHDNTNVQTWPRVSIWDWCGEFKRAWWRK